MDKAENADKAENKIKTLRDYLQLSQAAFAKPLDLSPTHIARFEQGVSKPSQSIIDHICESFHVDPRYFDHYKALERSECRVEKFFRGVF